MREFGLSNCQQKDEKLVRNKMGGKTTEKEKGREVERDKF